MHSLLFVEGWGNATLRTQIDRLLHKPRAPVSMALDLVEPGCDSDIVVEAVAKTRHFLPPEVTSGLLYKDVLRIAWPALIELLLTQLASMVDMMMVGQLGPWAITAVGLTIQPKFLMMAMFMAMNVGATALVARYKGANEPQKANAVLRQALLLTLVLSVAASVVGYVFSGQMVLIMGAEDAQTLAGGTVYLQIQMIGFVFMALSTTITAALRGVGNSKTAMMYNLAANIVNVIFNYLLIYGNYGFPEMGVAGASLATIIGQFVACFISFAVILRGKKYLILRLRDGFRPHWESLRSIFRIGFPALVEQLVMRAGVIIYSIMVASLGTVAYATHQVSLNILALSFMSGQAFAVSATSLVGQSLGKKRFDMAQAYSSRTRRVGMVFSLAMGLLFFFFGKQIVMLYSDDPTIILQGAYILKLVALIQPFQSSQFILAGALRGAGDTRSTAIIMFITVLLVRPLISGLCIYLLGLGLYGAWYALVADQLMRSLLVLIRYNSGKWKLIKV